MEQRESTEPEMTPETVMHAIKNVHAPVNRVKKQFLGMAQSKTDPTIWRDRRGCFYREVNGALVKMETFKDPDGNLMGRVMPKMNKAQKKQIKRAKTKARKES